MKKKREKIRKPPNFFGQLVMQHIGEKSKWSWWKKFKHLFKYCPMCLNQRAGLGKVKHAHQRKVYWTAYRRGRRT